jgi:Astacin (Peptidase family M12A)
MTRNFKRMHGTDYFGVPYDYDSTMHYSRFAFSKDYGNLPTIVYKVKLILGDRAAAKTMILNCYLQTPYNEGTRAKYHGLSLNDIRKINGMYKCVADWMPADKINTKSPN